MNKTGKTVGLFLVIIFGLGTYASAASEVILKLRDGNFIVKGTLINYDGRSYMVESPHFGKMTLDSNRFACKGKACPKEAKFMNASFPVNRSQNFGIFGSNTIGASLMPSLIEGYAKDIGAEYKKVIMDKAEEIKIEIKDKGGVKVAAVNLHSHGSGTSFPALISGAAQIGMSSRPIKKKEKDILKQSGFTGMTRSGREHVLALDGLLVILSPQNPIESLSMEQIAKIFSGQITDWAELGRKPGKINIYARDVKSGTYDTFKSLVLKPFKKKISAEAKRFESNADLSDQVASDADAIGFTGIAYQRNSKAIGISSACGIVKYPSIFNVKTEEYPLSRRLYLYTTKNLNSPYAREILDFAMSDKAQKIVKKVGFIDQKIASLPFSQQADRIAAGLNISQEEFNLGLVRRFTQEFKGAKRMSATFRFRQASTALDNKAISDIRRFAKTLKQKKFKGKQIFLVGFADSSGPANMNLVLSFQRANQVKEALVAASGGRINPEALNVRAYGELMPVSCNDSQIGMHKNRRVEVWVRG